MGVVDTFNHRESIVKMHTAEENALSLSLSIYENSISGETQRGPFRIDAAVYYDIIQTDICTPPYINIKMQLWLLQMIALLIVWNQTILRENMRNPKLSQP